MCCLLVSLHVKAAVDAAPAKVTRVCVLEVKSIPAAGLQTGNGMTGRRENALRLVLKEEVAT